MTKEPCPDEQQNDEGGDFIADGLEIRSIHIGGGQLHDGPGPVDGTEGTCDGVVSRDE